MIGAVIVVKEYCCEIALRRAVKSDEYWKLDRATFCAVKFWIWARGLTYTRRTPRFFTSIVFGCVQLIGSNYICQVRSRSTRTKGG